MRPARALAGLLLLAATACRDAAPAALHPLSVTPDYGASGARTAITIQGEGLVPQVRADFADGRKSALEATFTAQLRAEALDGAPIWLEEVRLLPSGGLAATVPASVPVGGYALVVRSPAGEEASLAGAYRAVTPVDAVAGFQFQELDAQRAGVSFTVSLLAVDGAGERVEGYEGSVTVGDSAGGLAPVTLGPFVRGALLGQVTVDAAAAQDVLTARDARGLTGSSNPFDVLPAPPAALSLSLPALPLPVGACAGPVALRSLDARGQTTPVAADEEISLLVLPEGEGLTLYADAACATSSHSVTLRAGSAEAGFFLRADRAGEWEVRAQPLTLPSFTARAQATP